MNEIYCFSCDSKIDPQFNFCPSCGVSIKCKSCDAPIQKGAKFCYGCGNSLVNETSNDTNLNKIKFRETKDEREYEVIFTDKVAADVKNVVANMISDKSWGYQKPEDFSGLLEFENVENVNNETEMTIDEESEVINNESPNEVKNEDVADFPHEKDLKMHIENANEKDWILVFAFYLSGYGTKTFNRKSVFDKYKLERKTTSRINHFTRTWESAFKDYFKTVNDDEIKINERGIQYVKKLLAGEVGLKKETPSRIVDKVKKESSSKTPEKSNYKNRNSVKIEDFDLYKGEGLAKLIEKVNATSAKDFIWCIAYYNKLILERDFFTDGNVDFAFKVLKLNHRPNNLRQTLSNIKNRDFLIDATEEKNWTLSRTGEIEFEKKIKNLNGGVL